MPVSSLARCRGVRFIMPSIGWESFLPMHSPNFHSRQLQIRGVVDMRKHNASTPAILLCSFAAACTTTKVVPTTAETHDHTATMATAAPQSTALPADAAGAPARLSASPRHGEWAMIRTGTGDSIRAWVVYPERSTKAPVVLVVHEIFGLSTWVRGVADQLAANGYIAIAPDLLTGKAPLEGDTLSYSVATTAIRTLAVDDVQRQLAAVGAHGMSLSA